MDYVLGDHYPLTEGARLQRLATGLERAFEAAFVAAEPDLREWMPSAAKEQEDAVAFVEGCSRAFEAAETFAYAIVATSGEVIGYVNLTPTGDHAVVGYWVAPAWRGLGIAPLAVRTLAAATFDAFPDAKRVHAHLDVANTASRRVLEKAGFAHHESFTRPPRTSSETDTEWLFIRERPPEPRV